MATARAASARAFSTRSRKPDAGSEIFAFIDATNGSEEKGVARSMDEHETREVGAAGGYRDVEVTLSEDDEEKGSRVLMGDELASVWGCPKAGLDWLPFPENVENDDTPPGSSPGDIKDCCPKSRRPLSSPELRCGAGGDP
jgi:hypothetical protein